MQLGAQLYTVRKYTKTLDDFAQTLQRIADIGYKTVQVSGTCEFEPEWLKEQLDSTGLRCVLTHTKPDKLIADPERVTAEHSVFGCKYIGLGSMERPDKEKPEEYYPLFRQTYLPIAECIKKSGGKFMYHNHAFEFERIGENGENILELMARDFHAEDLSFILDTYWVQAAGGDPASWIKKLSGRLECVHLKDMTFEKDETRMASVYEGNMNFDAIIEACAEAGTEYLLVELDNSYDKDPFDCLAQSFKNLKDRGLK